MRRGGAAYLAKPLVPLGLAARLLTFGAPRLFAGVTSFCLPRQPSPANARHIRS